MIILAEEVFGGPKHFQMRFYSLFFRFVDDFYYQASHHFSPKYWFSQNASTSSISFKGLQFGFSLRNICTSFSVFPGKHFPIKYWQIL